MDKALFWGINDYQYVPDLSGCVNDLIDYANLAVSKGFSYIALTNGMATDVRVRAELNTIVNNYKPGDRLFIAGSCHGSNAPDQNGDEADHRDELICTVNFPNGYIRDDEIRSILGGLPENAICDVFLDCCYAGTGTRLAPPVHRIPVIGNRYAPFTGKIKAKEKAVVVPGMRECLFAACGEGQTSSEVLIGGKPRGVFSYYVCKALRSYPTYTRDQIVNYARTKIAAIGLTQVPQLECQAGKAGQVPFT